MKWGNPNFDQLLEFMKHAYENDIRGMDHTFTRELISKASILEEFALHISSDKSNETGEDST